MGLGGAGGMAEWGSLVLSLKKASASRRGLTACWPSRSPAGPPTAEWANGGPAVLVPGIGRAEDRQQILALSHRRPWHQPIAKFSSDKRREASVTDVQLYAKIGTSPHALACFL